MSERCDVVVVGAGVGGLAVAIRLAATPGRRRVVVLERSPVVGGKVRTWQAGGYSFDIGPSLLTVPQVFDELFAVAGTSLAAEVDLVRLDPQFDHRWPDGSRLVTHDDPGATADAFHRFTPEGGAAWRRFDERGRRIWDVSVRTFFAGPMVGPLQLARRMRSPADLVTIDPLRTLHRAATRSFDDPRLVQWAGRYATYSGSSPYRAPATLACIPHLESRFGCWYPVGGLGSLVGAMARVAESVGVEVRTSAEVAAIETTGGRVSGVRLTDDARLVAPVVVANTDAEHLYADLLPDARALARVRRATPSTSAVVVAAGVRGVTPGQRHHTVWFSHDDRAEFAALEAGRLADDPTVYACVSSVTDPTQAPAGCENWFLLVNAPPGVDIDGAEQQRRLLELLAARGVDLRPRLEVARTITPGELAALHRSPGGAIYGTSSNGRRAAFLRPPNIGARRGLYLVGGSSHPGGGLPLVATSARIVAHLVTQRGA